MSHRFSVLIKETTLKCDPHKKMYAFSWEWKNILPNKTQPKPAKQALRLLSLYTLPCISLHSRFTAGNSVVWKCLSCLSWKCLSCIGISDCRPGVQGPRGQPTERWGGRAAANPLPILPQAEWLSPRAWSSMSMMPEGPTDKLVVWLRIKHPYFFPVMWMHALFSHFNDMIHDAGFLLQFHQCNPL